MVSHNLIPGQILGHFRLVEQIGAGGMGVVYRAWDTRLERDVAVKVLNVQTLSDGSARQRFRREALILSRLNHPNVESVYDFHSDQGVDYLVLEYVPGASLNERLRKGALPEPELLALGTQLARGLAAAHQQRILHRDLKPGNLRVTPDNVLKILDFGLAEVFILPEEETVLDTASRQSSDAGTPAYLSPEQIDGKEPDVRSDIYSAGLVLYEMATGSFPFPQRGQMLRDAILHRLPPSPRLKNKDLSADMEAVILKCLEKDPKLRYQSANELLGDLQELSRDSGPHRPIAIPEPVKRTRRLWTAVACIVLVLLAAGLIFRKRVLEQFGIVPRTVSLAVLPLHNRTGNPKLDYLGAGISEALTDDLSRMPDLQVTAASVARRYGSDGLDPRDAGRTLQVKSVLDGSITTANGLVEVPIELIDVSTGRRLWGQTYAGDLTHLADLQHQISTDVAYRLKLKFDPDTKARLKRQYSTNPSAYDSYLKGRFHLSQRSADSLQEAITDFQRALEQDPQYAPAYAGLADCYSLLGYYGLQKPIPLFTKAMAAAQQALEIDSTLGEAYTSRAIARTFLNFDWAGAEADYKRAIELNPKYVTAHTWYGLLLLMPLGRRSEAAAQLAYTQAADPDSLVGSISLATMDYLAGDFDKSIELIESRRHTLPAFEPALQILALDYLGKNMPEKVIELLEADSLPPETMRQRIVPLGIAYFRSGQKAKAHEQLKLAETSVRSGYVLCYETAALYTALHDHAQALNMLQLAYERRESNVVFLNVDPLLEPLRSEERFKKLLAAINVW